LPSCERRRFRKLDMEKGERVFDGRWRGIGRGDAGSARTSRREIWGAIVQLHGGGGEGGGKLGEVIEHVVWGGNGGNFSQKKEGGAT